MADCVEISREFGRRAAEELGIPIFLYEEAAAHNYRRKLPDVRQGEYEGLTERLKDPQWKPDFGPAELVPSWGATATGARMFLIAYNVNILGTANQAHRLALNVREAGRGPDEPGRLKDVKGMGWFVAEYKYGPGDCKPEQLPGHPHPRPFRRGQERRRRAECGRRRL
jgi:glutamate formiminotransferase/formiminotetrahydrofolate cyclodeaminase